MHKSSIHQSSKKLYLEVLRIIACFFVIFNHTGDNGFFLFARYPASTAAYWIYMFISILCKCAVPMFFAISGALLLPKNETLGQIFRKRILRILIALVVFSAAYYIFSIRADFSQGSLIGFFRSLYSGDICEAYWYLYAYIAFLLALPFLRAMVQKLEDKYFFYLFIIATLILSIVPIAEYALWHGETVLSTSFNISWLCIMGVLYPIIGYFIENRLEITKARRWIPVLWAADIVGIILTELATNHYINVTGLCSQANAQPFHYGFALMTVAAIFITAKAIADDTEASSAAKANASGASAAKASASEASTAKANAAGASATWIATSVGGATFGIYLIHVPVIEVSFYRILPFLTNRLGLNDMVSALIFCLFVMAASYVITFLLKLIPGVKKIL